MELRDLMVLCTAIELSIEEYFCDDLGVSIDYPGPQLFARVFSGRIATLSGAGTTTQQCLVPDVRNAMVLADAARTEARPSRGVDTQTGRTLTIVRVSLQHARGPSESFVLSDAVNHCVPGPFAPAFSALLRALRDLHGPLPEPLAERWDLALTWAAPVELGTMWRAGEPVRLPNVVTAFCHDGPLYVRTGQPQWGERSALYHLEGDVLRCLDDGTRVPSLAGPRPSWRLPCGGGWIALHTERDTPRIVARRNDSRGVYVQRG